MGPRRNPYAPSMNAKFGESDSRSSCRIRRIAPSADLPSRHEASAWLKSLNCVSISSQGRIHGTFHPGKSDTLNFIKYRAASSAKGHHNLPSETMKYGVAGPRGNLGTPQNLGHFPLAAVPRPHLGSTSNDKDFATVQNPTPVHTCWRGTPRPRHPRGPPLSPLLSHTSPAPAR